MKKKYDSPKAKKLEFNYSEVVTSSGSGTSDSGYTQERYYTSPQAGSPPPCAFQWRYVSNCF